MWLDILGDKELSSWASQMPIANIGWAYILIENIFLLQDFMWLWSELHKGQSWATLAFEGRGKVCRYEISQMHKRWGINNVGFVESNCDWMFWFHAIFNTCRTLSQVQAKVWSYSQAFQSAVSMKDAILNKAVLIQSKGISCTDMKGERQCWLGLRTSEKDLRLEIELPVD